MKSPHSVPMGQIISKMKLSKCLH